jgi:hypothetical protein
MLGSAMLRWRPTRKSSHMRMSKDKVHTKDSYWYVKMIYDSRWLSRVSIISLGVVEMLLNG